MFTIQPLPLPSAAQMLLAIDPAADPATQVGFEAQFSTLLASAVPATAPPSPAISPDRLALPGARAGKNEAANGKPLGKQSGNILPDPLAALIALPSEGEPEPIVDLAALPSEGDPAPRAHEIFPGPATSQPPRDAAPPLADLAVQLANAQIPASTLLADPKQAPAAKTTVPAAPVAAGPARPSRWLAVASTAPATATTAMPGTPASGAALPPPDGKFEPAAQVARAAEQPESQGPATAAATPAIRIPLARPLPMGLAVRRPRSEVDLLAVFSADTAPAAKLKSATSPTQIILQPVGQAQAASLALVQQAGKAVDAAAPPALIEAPAAQPGFAPAYAGLEAIAASPQQPNAPAGVAAAAAPISPAQPHDFAALIDQLVEARQAVQSTLTSQTVQASVQHTEFGRVSLTFQQDAGGLTVSFANPDPDLARAVQNLVPPAMSADTGTSAQRQDGQGGASTASGQPQGQPQGQLSAQQQRGQSPQRETAFGSAAQNSQDGNDTKTASGPRNGIFA